MKSLVSSCIVLVFSSSCDDDLKRPDIFFSIDDFSSFVCDNDLDLGSDLGLDLGSDLGLGSGFRVSDNNFS